MKIRIRYLEFIHNFWFT